MSLFYYFVRNSLVALLEAPCAPQSEAVEAAEPVPTERARVAYNTPRIVYPNYLIIYLGCLGRSFAWN